MACVVQHRSSAFGRNSRHGFQTTVHKDSKLLILDSYMAAVLPHTPRMVFMADYLRAGLPRPDRNRASSIAFRS
jgi:hypothetical protein